VRESLSNVLDISSPPEQIRTIDSDDEDDDDDDDEDDDEDGVQMDIMTGSEEGLLTQ
jgi:hypothetical protein